MLTKMYKYTVYFLRIECMVHDLKHNPELLAPLTKVRMLYITQALHTFNRGQIWRLREPFHNTEFVFLQCEKLQKCNTFLC